MEEQKELEQVINDAANAKITALEKKHNEELESIKMEGAGKKKPPKSLNGAKKTAFG